MTETAQLTERYASAFGAGELGYQVGLAHDIGKYSIEFLKRILQNGPKVDHSTAGAKEANSCINIWASYCVAGHHGGLPDGGDGSDTGVESTLTGKLKRGNLPDYSSFRNYLELKKPNKVPNLKLFEEKKQGYMISFFTRMLFSCLVDADFINTETFVSNGSIKRSDYDSIEILNTRFTEKIQPLLKPTNEINKRRTEILTACLNKASLPKGLFTLTVPTGGGKTKSSLAFALKHAIKHNMARVIYVIPYTSIIEQNASIFREMLGERNVVEHHSNVLYDDSENEEMEMKRLSTENWDAPLIVTTNVQFFESLYASRTSQCRKLHNIANSVIIFDEAQMLPTPYLIPCTRAIAELVLNYGCSAVLCSATQPALQTFFSKMNCTEISDDPKDLYGFFRRTRIVNEKQLSDEELATRLNECKQVLCIVNTRRHAQNIYELIQGKDKVHLSTLMYPEHRKEKLIEIKERLNNGLPCKVISTSLIEAGVDLDFPVVYRAEAGLDSQIQAAGRCNREGRNKPEDSIVHVFKPEDKYQAPLTLRQPIEIASMIEREFEDTASLEAIRRYFEILYKVKGSGLDNKDIVSRLDNCKTSIPFREIAYQMKIIEEPTYDIFIPIEPFAESLLIRLQSGERNKDLMRQISMFCVGVRKQDYRKLLESGVIEPLDSEIAVLIDRESYSKETGLPASVETGKGVFV